MEKQTLARLSAVNFFHTLVARESNGDWAYAIRCDLDKTSVVWQHPNLGTLLAEMRRQILKKEIALRQKKVEQFKIITLNGSS